MEGRQCDVVRSGNDPVHAFRELTQNQRRQWFDELVTKAQQPGTDAINWAIARKDVSSVIGWFFIGGEGERRFGYLLNRGFWNRGYMTEALRAVLAYEFDTRGASQVSATCSTSNPASSRVMEKAGMRHEKTVYDADFEGNWDERHHYIITKAEYESCRDEFGGPF